MSYKQRLIGKKCKGFVLALGIGLGVFGLVLIKKTIVPSSISLPPFLPPPPVNKNLFIGTRVNLNSKWVGTLKVPRSVRILVLAGHADSQGLQSGTLGEAVGVKGAVPMDPKISDELFWNIKVRDAVVRLGKERRLKITSYDPQIRNIADEYDPRTNWSVGAQSAKEGSYVLEIHFDAYGKYGFGSGLIPSLSPNLNKVDESLARSFGRYPQLFRGGLGAARRDIRILEIGKLEGKLESDLRNLETRKETIRAIALKILDAIDQGLDR